MLSEDLEALAKIRRLKERLGRSLSARFLVRFHMSLILGGAIAAGWVADYLMLKEGLDSMVRRYPVAVLVAYLGFVAGAWLWIEYSGIRDYIKARKARELLDEVDEVKAHRAAKKKDSHWWDSLDPSGGIPVDGEGCLFVLGAFLVVAAAIFILYAAGGYLLMDAGGFFAEIVFELLLAAGLVRGMRKIDSPSWTGSMFSVTWPALAVSLALSVAVGSWAQAMYPEAKTLPEAFAKWQAEKPSWNFHRKKSGS